MAKNQKVTLSPEVLRALKRFLDLPGGCDIPITVSMPLEYETMARQVIDEIMSNGYQTNKAIIDVAERNGKEENTVKVQYRNYLTERGIKGVKKP